MDLLDRLLGHDAWTTRQLLLQCRQLSDAQLDQRFTIDQRSLRELWLHIIGNIEVWTALMAGKESRDSETGAAMPAPSVDALLERHAAAARTFATLARTIAHEGRLDATFSDTLDDPPQPKPFGAVIVHLVTHSMHHRAQAMFMMEQLGLTEHIEGDALSWEFAAFGWQ